MLAIASVQFEWTWNRFQDEFSTNVSSLTKGITLAVITPDFGKTWRAQATCLNSSSKASSQLVQQAQIT